DYRLDNSTAYPNNQYRPIPYNLPYSSGALYWIKQIKMNGHYEATGYYPCAAWDMNYFNFDFGPYTANCLTRQSTSYGSSFGSDALPIRLVQKHAGE
ncbi:MAG: hypothetical protein K2J96_02785, partial [Bacteroidaceae bacterium]|nr:hypothetical protein [Bacteroidaceae bacterium]